MSNPIQWRAPEFEYRAKTMGWYWLSILLAVLILAVAVWQKNFLFGIFVVIAEILILVWANREPRMIEFALTEHGIQIGGSKTELYAEIESFSLAPNPGEWAALTLRFKRRLRPVLHALLPSARLAEIETKLQSFLKQQDYQESFLEILEKISRF